MTLESPLPYDHDDPVVELLRAYLVVNRKPARDGQHWAEAVSETVHDAKDILADYTQRMIRAELCDVADEIVRELMCCYEYWETTDEDRAKEGWKPKHGICYWAGACEALIRDRASNGRQS